MRRIDFYRIFLGNFFVYLLDDEEMKKVCMIGNTLHFSGALQVFRNVAAQAKADGWEPHYICHMTRKGEIIPDVSMFETSQCLSNENVSREEYGPMLAELANKFDVVHTSLLPQDWRFVFKKHCTRPMVETYHSPDGWSRTWKQYSLRLKHGVEKPADVTVGVSHGLTKMIKRDLGESAKVETIINGVAIPPEIAPGGDYVTYCGRIAADKGLPDWIAVAHRVRELVPHVKFQWVGALSPQYDPFLMECLYRACPWIEFVGFTEDPSPYYRRSRCLLLTSNSEGLPMTILEAHAHGIPSVAFDVGDIKEAKGEMHRVGDIGAMADSVAATFYNTKEWSQNRYSLRSWACKHFSQYAMGEKYVAIYNRLLESA